MKLGNSIIQQYIEMGIKKVSLYKTIINNEKIEFKWRPLREWEDTEALFFALEFIDEYTRNWITSSVQQRKKLDKDKVSSGQIRKFERIYSMYSILYAIKDFYDEITFEQIEKLDIDHLEFHNIISKVTGTKDGQETVATFPDN